jgi:glycosyltransferase involved in cell wall biosynthesis
MKRKASSKEISALTGLPLVSVIIPTHNRALLLQQAVNSVYNQEGLGQEFAIELIVVDGASSDHTPDLMRSYPQARYIRLEKNLGAAACRNTGLQSSTGKYIGFLDDDDLWLPYKLSLQIPALESHPEIGLVYSQSIVKIGSKFHIDPQKSDTASGSVFSQLLVGNFIGIRTVLVRRDAFDKAGYFDEQLWIYETNEMFLRLAFHVSFLFVPGPVAIYRLSPRGTYMTLINQRDAEQAVRLIIQKVVSLLERSGKHHSDLIPKAKARLGLWIAAVKEESGDFKEMQSYLVKSLEEFPWLVRETWAWRLLSRMGLRFAFSSDSPNTALRAFSADVVRAGRKLPWSERMKVRRSLAYLWIEAAATIASRCSKRNPKAGYAAAHALLYDPTIILRMDIIRLLLSIGSASPNPAGVPRPFAAG